MNFCRCREDGIKRSDVGRLGNNTRPPDDYLCVAFLPDCKVIQKCATENIFRLKHVRKFSPPELDVTLPEMSDPCSMQTLNSIPVSFNFKPTFITLYKII